MTSSQRRVKQTIIASIYLVIIATIVFLIVMVLFPTNSVVVEDKLLIQPIQVIKWGKIDLGNGKSDFWAEISNPNDEYGIDKLGYTFVLRKSNGDELRKNGETFILPGDKKRYVLLFEIVSEYELQTFEIGEESQWTQLSRFDLPELGVRNTRVGYSSKVGNDFTVFGTLTNASPFNLKNIQVIAIITNDSGDIIAVNQTLIRDVLTSESRDFEMIWKNKLDGVSIFNTKIYTQSNVLNDKALLIELQQQPLF